ncbi:tetratricopeptide repeat-containing sensor histidine kinase [Flavobacterium sp. JP2137]|uniref:tetratricopeptide repeat-containing sensor histidine kinase n=1 Tax=Flavobacterium sp. JP2137 TaxID=3414510 RepID=UPI003D2FBEA8
MKFPLYCILIAFLCIQCQDHDRKKALTQYQLYLNKLNDSTTPLPEREHYLDSITELFDHENNTAEHRSHLKETAAAAYNQGYEQRYFELSKTLYKQSVNKQDSSLTAQALYFIGDYYEERNQSDSAFYYYSKSHNLYRSLNDTLKQVKTSLYKAGILFDEGIYNESEAEILKTLKLLNNNTEQRYLYECYNLLSIVLSQNSQHKEALLYQYKALQTLDELKKTDFSPKVLRNSQVYCYNNMGNTYDKLLDFEQAESLYTKGLSFPNLKREQPMLYAMLLNNLGNNYMQRQRHTEAYPLLIESLEIRDSLDLKPGIITSKIRLGDYHIHLRDTTAALQYWKDAYTLAKETRSNDDIVRSLKLLSNYDRSKAQYYSDLCFKAHDSLKKIEMQTKNKFARIQYETDEVEQKNELLVRRVSMMGLAVGGLTLLILGLIVIYRLEANNKRLRYLQEQQNSKEVIYKLLLQQDELGQQVLLKERNRIAKELHDGIINTLFSIQLHVGKSDDAQKNRLIADLERASEQIRQVSHDLKDQSFVQSNFSVLIEALIDKQPQETTAFESLIPKNLDWSAFSYEQKINIYRLLQEALQNVLKHAQATKCFVVLSENATDLIVKVQDNGIGFNSDKVHKGIGLRNLEERMEELGGSWTIDSKIGVGSTVKFVIPKKKTEG